MFEVKAELANTAEAAPPRGDLLISRENGEYLRTCHLEEDVRLQGAHVDTDIRLGHHTIVIAVTVRVMEQITGADGFNISVEDDQACYGSNLASARDTTNVGLTNHPLTYWHSASLRITAVNDNFTGGAA